jgi:L-lactate dehydrogenase complex protein LldG
MNEAREEILGSLRRALGRGPLAAEAAAGLALRIAAHSRNLIPRRAAALDEEGLLALFVAMAEEAGASVRRVERLEAVAGAVAEYLAGENLPASVVMAPDEGLDAIPWGERPLMAIRRGRAEAPDAASLTPAFAAVAETGTLMLISGPRTPTSLNFLPDTHIVVLRREQLVASYEDGFDRLRAAAEKEGWPRTVNFITGPSRTADIELQIELGAHGPRRLHIVLVDDKNPA